jgi:hypothetical protein
LDNPMVKSPRFVELAKDNAVYDLH